MDERAKGGDGGWECKIGSRAQRGWGCPLVAYGRGLSLLVRDAAPENACDDGRFGSCTAGGRSSAHSGPGLGMPCMFAGIRGWGERIAPSAGCDADCGVPAAG